MKLVIRSVGTGTHQNLRGWEPDDPRSFAVFVHVGVGMKSGKGSDVFSIRVATPDGLSSLDGEGNIIAERPLLVVREYDSEVILEWLERVVSRCEADSWTSCVDNLRRYFDWEYDSYKEK